MSSFHDANPGAKTGASAGASAGAKADAAAFAYEADRLRASGALGAFGRLVELFDFFVSRGPDGAPVSQAEIAQAVFGNIDTGGDDATVRVYVHRLRKRLEDHYSAMDTGKLAGRLAVPAGTYALRYEALPAGQNPAKFGHWASGKWFIALFPAALLAVFIIARFGPGSTAPPPPNAIWQPFLESQRPIILAVGDYYIFGEIDPVRPEDGRLIRDFQINSATDLVRAQQAGSDRYAYAEDFGLNYLPLSVAYGLQELMPVLRQHEAGISVMPASQISSDTFRTHNVVYLGLFSGMGLLEDVNFTGSGIILGPSYDELINTASGRRYVSTEARSVASSNYYRDYGYLSVFKEPGGALVAIVAGARDTGLRGAAPIAVQNQLPGQIEALAGNDTGFEALFEITGQQGTDLNQKLVAAQKRKSPQEGTPLGTPLSAP